MTTTKDKLEFALAMGRHTRASLRQVQALMRYAVTLQRLAEDDCNVATDDAGLGKRHHKRVSIQRKIRLVCAEIALDGDRPNTLRKAGMSCEAVFSGDPRGCVLKIRVPDGFSNSFGDEGIVVPS